MAFVSLQSVHHFQPPRSAGRPVKGCSAARKRGASTVSNAHKNPMAHTPNVSPSARLADFDLIECVDLTTSLPVESRDSFGESALGFGGTENAQGNVHCPQYR